MFIFLMPKINYTRVFKNAIALCGLLILSDSALAESREPTALECRELAHEIVNHSFGFGEFVNALEDYNPSEGTQHADAIFSSYFNHDPALFNYFRTGGYLLHFPQQAGRSIFTIYNPLLDIALIAKIHLDSDICQSLTPNAIRFEYFEILAGETIRKEKLPDADFPYPEWVSGYDPKELCGAHALQIPVINQDLLHKLANRKDITAAGNLFSPESRTYIDRIRLLIAYNIHKTTIDRDKPQLDQRVQQEIDQTNNLEWIEHWKSYPFRESFSYCTSTACDTGLKYYRSDDGIHLACTYFDVESTVTNVYPMPVGRSLTTLSKTIQTAVNKSGGKQTSSPQNAFSLSTPSVTIFVSPPASGDVGHCSGVISINPILKRAENITEIICQADDGSSTENLGKAFEKRFRQQQFFKSGPDESGHTQLTRTIHFEWQDDRDILDRKTQVNASGIEISSYHLKPNADYQPLPNRYPTGYPLEAKRNEIEGFCDLVFSVSTSGKAENLKIESCQTADGKPGTLFEKTALKTAQRLRFRSLKWERQFVQVENVRRRVAFRL